MTDSEIMRDVWKQLNAAEDAINRIKVLQNEINTGEWRTPDVGTWDLQGDVENQSQHLVAIGCLATELSAIHRELAEAIKTAIMGDHKELE